MRPGPDAAAAWAAVILAAGESRRMGEPKQLLPFEGQPLVARAARQTLEAGFWPVIVVLGASREAVRPALARLPVLTIDNPAWMEGMASSLRAGLAAVGQFSRTIPGALLGVCDQPEFRAETARRLREAAIAAPSGMAAARYEGRLGVPACFRREHFTALAALTGEQGARSFLQQHAASVAAVDLPELAIDFDTRSEYDRHLR